MKATERVVVTVEDAAEKLRGKPAELLQAIKDNDWDEADARYMEVAQALLAILMPARTVLNQCIDEFQELYEAAARRREEDGQQPGGGGVSHDGQGSSATALGTTRGTTNRARAPDYSRICAPRSPQFQDGLQVDSAAPDASWSRGASSGPPRNRLDNIRGIYKAGDVGTCLPCILVQEI